MCARQLGRADLTFSGVWALDGASTWARLLILAATAFTVLLTPGWFHSDRRHGEYYSVLLFSALGAMALAGAADLMQLVMAVLLSSVTGYTMASYHRDRKSTRLNSRHYCASRMPSSALNKQKSYRN